MPCFSREFANAAAHAVQLTADVEILQSLASRSDEKLRVSQVETIYEISFLKAFGHWEDFLEQTFVRYLCGYRCSSGQQVTKSGFYANRIFDAHKLIQGNRQYLLWHSVDKVIGRSKKFFINGRHQSVLQSHQANIDAFGKIRHHIAHKQPHARAEFDASTLLLTGRRFRGSSAGKFLRSWTVLPNGDPARWLERALFELSAIATQIDT